MNFEIKHRFSHKLLFKFKCESLKICLEKAVNVGADLKGAYLSEANLSGAYLSEANLSGAYLSGAYLSETNLMGAYLNRADLSGADLRGSDLNGADLNGADLSGADLRGSDLSGAYLKGSDLSEANLSGADLRGSDLSGAYLSGADLSGADGKMTKIKNTPIQILGLHWDVFIFDKDMKIGCEYHSIKNWQKYDNAKIETMDRNALEFWKTNKESLITICKANGRE